MLYLAKMITCHLLEGSGTGTQITFKFKAFLWCHKKKYGSYNTRLIMVVDVFLENEMEDVKIVRLNRFVPEVYACPTHQACIMSTKEYSSYPLNGPLPY